MSAPLDPAALAAIEDYLAELVDAGIVEMRLAEDGATVQYRLSPDHELLVRALLGLDPMPEIDPAAADRRRWYGP